MKLKWTEKRWEKRNSFSIADYLMEREIKKKNIVNWENGHTTAEHSMLSRKYGNIESALGAILYEIVVIAISVIIFCVFVY